MAGKVSKTSLLTTHKHELVKNYTEFDGQGRASKVYMAASTAADGDPCLVTEYIYNGPTSTVIKARKEGTETWDGTWDADFTVTVQGD